MLAASWRPGDDSQVMTSAVLYTVAMCLQIWHLESISSSLESPTPTRGGHEHAAPKIGGTELDDFDSRRKPG